MRKITILAMAIFVILLAETGHSADMSSLPDMGSTAGSLLTLEEEKQLGKEFMHSVQTQLKLNTNPLVNEYIQSLGERLVSQLDHVDHQFTFFVVEDTSINAFAGPGGYIGIHSGLILAAKNEDELASVISHEIAHVSQRHLVRTFEKQSDMALSAMAAIFAAAILGKADGQVGEAIIASTIANSTQSQLNFSRAHEREADNVGIVLMVKAGYNPLYMASFFETLLSKHRYTENNLPEFILTHPLTTSRVADARNRALQFKISPSQRDTLDFDLIQVRLMDSSAKKTLAEPTLYKGLGAQYQEILQLTAEKQFSKANAKLDELMARDQQRIIYIVTKIEIALAQENFSEGIKIASQALLNHPHNNPLTMISAKLFLRAGKTQAAYNIIKNHIARGHTEPELYKMLADSAQQIGQLSEAYEALAEYYYQNRELFTAIEHLRRAINTESFNSHRALKLTSRLKAIQAEVINNQPDNVSHSGR